MNIEKLLTSLLLSSYITLKKVSSYYSTLKNVKQKTYLSLLRVFNIFINVGYVYMLVWQGKTDGFGFSVSTKLIKILA